MSGQGQKSHCFTLTSHGIARVLVTPCKVSDAFDLAVQSPPTQRDFHAIWDTGATNSVITKAVAAACGLSPSGMVKVSGVHGTQDVFTYFVNVVLPNGLMVRGLRVTEGILPGGTDGDLLFGMDIITQGDFSISNVGGNTTFSFRMPSMKTIDFAKEESLKSGGGHGASGAPNRKFGKQFGKNKR